MKDYLNKRSFNKPFIVPTWYGVAYFVLIVQIFSMSFFRPQAPYHAVGLSLIIFGLLAMVQSNENLRNLELRVDSPEPTQVGSFAKLRVRLRAKDKKVRINLVVSCADAKRWIFPAVWPFNRLFKSSFSVLGPESLEFLKEESSFTVPILCKQVGIRRLPLVQVSSLSYFGLFFVWRWYALEDIEVVSYPKPSGSMQLPIVAAVLPRGIEEGEFNGHRTFVVGSSMRQVDWKAFARGRPLLLKDFQRQISDEELDLDINQVSHLSLEEQLEQLSLWIHQCNTLKLRYSLRIGDRFLPRANGRIHMFKALALLAQAGEQ